MVNYYKTFVQLMLAAADADKSMAIFITHFGQPNE